MNIQSFLRHADQVTESVGKVLSWLCLWITVGTFLVVLVRYGFQSSRIGGLSLNALQESIMYSHAALFMLAAGYALKHDEHVRVDVFYRRLSPQRKAVIDLFGTFFLLLPLSTVIFYTSLDFVSVAWTMGERSREADGLPWVYVLKALIPISAGMLMLQGIVEALRQGLVLLGKPLSVAHDSRGGV